MGMIDLSGGAPDLAIMDFNTAKEMAETLHTAYPGHMWAVTCEGDKGVASVRNLALSGEWGFILKLSDMYSSSDWKKKVIMAGGELLERFKLRRGLADQEAISSIQNDFSGRSIGDYAK